jgi:TetR/AcrR family transcriptional regulator
MESTREKILDEAARLFAVQGYEGTGVQDICDCSDVTKPTLYYHFGSKDGLLAALFEARFGSFNACIRAAAEHSGARRGDLAGVLTSTMASFIDASKADPDFARIRLASSFCPPSSVAYRIVRPHLEALYSILETTFIVATLDHGNMVGRELQYTASFIGTADAYVGLYLAGDIDPDEPFIRRVVHYFMHGIFS